LGRWESEARHGIVVATRIADQHGEDVALLWFREHERLPLHTARDCPMPADGIATPDDSPDRSGTGPPLSSVA
jgi:hypothetical protein